MTKAGQGKSLLITGPAGTGKTTHCIGLCLQSMAEGGPNRVIFLVPSPDAVQYTEKQLLRSSTCRGILGHTVTDFLGLSRRILRHAGCFPLRQIAPLERQYLIANIIQNKTLTFFENVKGYDGFVDVLAAFIAEMKRGMISPEHFLRGCLPAPAQDGIREKKVRELYTVYRAYHDVLRERNAYDIEGLEWKAAEALSGDASLLSDVDSLFVDGFATYTPVEFEILSNLINRTRESHITLCYEDNRPDIFNFVEGTRRELKQLCQRGELLLDGVRRSPGPLMHVDRTLFSESDKEIEAGTAVEILPCPDPYREAENVALHIERLHRQEGLAFSDFLLILRDVSEYSSFIAEAFAKRGIPYFLSSPRAMAQEPLVRGVLRALQLVNGAFGRENLLYTLRNSYLGNHTEFIALLHNYADEYGLWDEEHFREPWDQIGRTAQNIEPLNDLKIRFLHKLDNLRSAARTVSSPDEFRQLVFHTITEFGFLNRAEENQESCEKGPNRGPDVSPPASSEYRCLGGIARLLQTMCDYAHTTGVQRADYGACLEMLERGLTWTPLPSPPRNPNSVRISSIVGGTPPEAPVVFVCGLCERLFPREAANEPFFKDQERRLINRREKIVLNEQLPLSSGERFFFYVAVSRATNRLILTYPTADGAGKELARSHYVEEVARLFRDLKETMDADSSVTDLAAQTALLTSTDHARYYVAHHLSRPAEEPFRDQNIALAAMVYNELLRLGELGPVDLTFSPVRERLSDQSSADLREKEAYLTSVSELEAFARCPFRHFCEYRLRLKELPRYEFGPVEEGMLYHDVLARLYRETYVSSCDNSHGGDDAARTEPKGIEHLSAKELDARLTLLVDEFISKGYSRLFLAPRMAVRRRAIQTRIKDFLLKEMENERTNATRPTYFELSFGKGKSHQSADPRSTEEPIPIQSEGGHAIRISGRMDRVDTFEGKGETFGIVLDYKRGGHISRGDLGRGTLLQPGIYLLALKRLFGIAPAGAFYYSISSGRKRGIFAKEEEKSLRGQGDVSRIDKATFDEIHELMELNARQAVEVVQRIVRGEIAVRPADKSECRTCPFTSLCRIRELKTLP